MTFPQEINDKCVLRGFYNLYKFVSGEAVINQLTPEVGTLTREVREHYREHVPWMSNNIDAYLIAPWYDYITSYCHRIPRLFYAQGGAIRGSETAARARGAQWSAPAAAGRLAAAAGAAAAAAAAGSRRAAPTAPTAA